MDISQPRDRPSPAEDERLERICLDSREEACNLGFSKRNADIFLGYTLIGEEPHLFDESGFRAYMKKQRKTPNTIESCVENASQLEGYLGKSGKSASDCKEEDLDEFIASEVDNKKIAKFIWTLQYYLSFLDNDALLRHVRRVREKHTAKKRRPFEIKDFMGVRSKSIDKLAEQRIETVGDMLKAAKTKKQRTELAKKTAVKAEEILELAKLSNLSQVGGVRSVRARLYYDAGIDTIEKMSNMTGEELRDVISEYIEKTGFDGIPPTPKEAENAVKDAKKLKDEIGL